MILLDTHIWVWWMTGLNKLSIKQQKALKEFEKSDKVAIRVISCWEVAKLVEYKRLIIPIDVNLWIKQALNYSPINLIQLTPEIALKSTQLPEGFHNDPADQIIVATALFYDIPLLTSDKRIRNYKPVNTI